MATRGAVRLARPITKTPTPFQCRGFATDSSPPTKRAVVGSFLFRRHDDGTPRVALFKRSSQVKTYQHKYAAIGGGVESSDNSPFQAALREIHEESSLNSSHLKHLSSGKPYSFVDSSVNYEWSVYPFAFLWPAEANDALKLGWEHEGHAWFIPREIREEDVAGGVVESLRRVWPEGVLGYAEALCRYCLGEAVGQHTQIDARQDANEAFSIFRQTVNDLDVESCDSSASEWRRLVRLAAWHTWNNAEASIKAPLLARLLPGLEMVEKLLEPQGKKLAPQFEKLASMSLGIIEVRHMENAPVRAQENESWLTRRAEKYFSGLWKTS